MAPKWFRIIPYGYKWSHGPIWEPRGPNLGAMGSNLGAMGAFGDHGTRLGTTVGANLATMGIMGPNYTKFGDRGIQLGSTGTQLGNKRAQHATKCSQRPYSANIKTSCILIMKFIIS